MWWPRTRFDLHKHKRQRIIKYGPSLFCVMRLSRRFHDSLAAVLQIATVVLIVVDVDVVKKNQTPGVALFVMQTSAAAFHVFYVFLYVSSDFDNTQNQYKWLEYAVSATAGTVALLSVDETDSRIIAPLAVIAVFQQAAGFALDPLRASYAYRRMSFDTKEMAYGALIEDCGKPRQRNSFVDIVAPNGIKQPIGAVLTEGTPSWSALIAFLFAACGQLTEFGFVIAATTDAPIGLPVSYILGWSCFGVHCAFRQLTLRGVVKNPALQSRYEDMAWVEAIYSALGWTSKLAVFIPEWLYLRGESAAIVNGVALGVIVISIVALTYTARQTAQ